MTKSKKTKSIKEQKKRGHKITSYSHAQDTMQIIYGVKDAVKKGIMFMKNVEKKMDLCYDGNAPSIVLNVKEYKNGYIDIRKRGGKIRVITEITEDNVEYCKELMEIVDEFRHLDNVQGGTAISENEYMATNILHESKPLTQVVYSNVRDIVEQQQKFFDSLWKTAIPAKQKIREFSKKINRENNDLFSVLSNEIRRSMIFSLYEEDMTMSQLAKKFNMTLQAMQKHVPKVIKTDLVKKNTDGKMSLTDIGYVLAHQIPSIEFLSDNNSYLKTHSLSSLPVQFLQRIGDLKKFEMVSKFENSEKYADFLIEAEEYIKILSAQNYFDLNTDVVSEILKKKIRISQISDEPTIVSLRYEKGKKSKKKISPTDGIFGKKITKNVPLITCISKKSACLGFLYENGTIDSNNLMWSKDQKFISWCNDFFDHVWKLK
jgi:predicted transcriptional regulator